MSPAKNPGKIRGTFLITFGRLALVAGLTALTSCAEATDLQNLTSRARISIVNFGTGLTVEVDIWSPTYTGAEHVTRTVASGNTSEVLYPAFHGAVITFALRVPSDPSVLQSFTKNCFPGPDMLDASGVYGQVDLALVSPTEIQAFCSGAGLDGAGWDTNSLP